MELYPSFETDGYHELRKWMDDEATNDILGGLRKAGLDIPDETPPND